MDDVGSNGPKKKICRSFLVDGKFVGKDIPSTRIPQDLDSIIWTRLLTTNRYIQLFAKAVRQAINSNARRIKG
jgi:hypothetical protein